MKMMTDMTNILSATVYTENSGRTLVDDWWAQVIHRYPNNNNNNEKKTIGNPDEISDGTHIRLLNIEDAEESPMTKVIAKETEIVNKVQDNIGNRHGDIEWQNFDALQTVKYKCPDHISPKEIVHRNQPNNDRGNHKECQIEPDSIRSKNPILTHHFKGEESIKDKHQRIVHPLKNKENKFKCESQIKATKNAQDMLLLLENLKGSLIYNDENMNAIISKPMTTLCSPE